MDLGEVVWDDVDCIGLAQNRGRWKALVNSVFKCFLGVKCGGCVWLATLPPSVSRLPRQCGILNISQPYRPPRPVTGIALLTLLFLLSGSIKCWETIEWPNNWWPLD
jgi:hypothetical protein